MPNRKISELSNIGSLSGTEEVELRFGSDNYSCTINQLRELINPSDIRSTKVTIPAAEVLALNSVPKILIAAPGANKYIEIIRLSVFLDFNSSPYATYIELAIFVGSQYSGAFNISAGSDYLDYRGQAVEGPFSLNQAVTAQVKDGNPTDGNSPIIISVTYRIVDLTT